MLPRLRLILFSTFILVLIFYHFEAIQEQIQWTTPISKENRIQSRAVVYIPASCQGLKKPKNIIPPEPSSAELLELNSLGHTLSQDDPRIIDYLWKHCKNYLRPPNGKPTRKSGNYRTSMGQDDVVLRILSNMTGGFFIESGSLDGVISSNTYKLEKEFGWTGLLIEADPLNIKTMHVRHNRNAWVSQACLSPEDHPLRVQFRQAGGWRDSGKINLEISKSASNSTSNSEVFEVQCFPLYSFLTALNVSVVDYLSLDIEGDEFKVLRTIPYSKVLIKVLTVEILGAPEGPEAIHALLEANDFHLLTKFYWQTHVFDLVFVHNSLLISEDTLRYFEKNKVG